MLKNIWFSPFKVWSICSFIFPCLHCVFNTVAKPHPDRTRWNHHLNGSSDRLATFSFISENSQAIDVKWSMAFYCNVNRCKWKGWYLIDWSLLYLLYIVSTTFCLRSSGQKLTSTDGDRCAYILQKQSIWGNVLATTDWCSWFLCTNKTKAVQQSAFLPFQPWKVFWFSCCSSNFWTRSHDVILSKRCST